MNIIVDMTYDKLNTSSFLRRKDNDVLLSWKQWSDFAQTVLIVTSFESKQMLSRRWERKHANLMKSGNDDPKRDIVNYISDGRHERIFSKLNDLLITSQSHSLDRYFES